MFFFGECSCQFLFGVRNYRRVPMKLCVLVFTLQLLSVILFSSVMGLYNMHFTLSLNKMDFFLSRNNSLCKHLYERRICCHQDLLFETTFSDVVII